MSNTSSQPTCSQHSLFTLQRTVGNWGIGQMLESSAGQSQAALSGLSVSRPTDAHEIEAERIAREVTDTTHLADSVQPTGGASAALPIPEVNVARWAGTGQQLSPEIRTRFESRLGRDLSHVRVHAGAQAAESAESLQASAYTVGRDIVFGKGEYVPHTSSGKQLIAHELTHVIQQSKGSSSNLGQGLTSQASAPTTMVHRAPKEDWDFTPQDYGALVKAKGKLTIAADSSWFPSVLHKNLLNTLDYLLDPKRQPPATEGVNVKDFYHGHVVLTKSKHPKGIPQNIFEKMTVFEEQQKELRKKVAVDDKVPKQNLEAFRKGEEAIRPLATDLLSQLSKTKGVGVVYHTFELKTPSDLQSKGKVLDNSDPRRNYFTPLETNKPVPFRAPQPNVASSYLNWSWHIMEFSFLVDNKGEVHIRPGSNEILSTVTGEP
jgi:hypothetical protein